MVNDYATSRTLSIRAPMSIPMEEQWFEQAVADQGKDGYHFVACLIADDRPIGTIGLFELDLLTAARAWASRSARRRTAARATGPT